MEGIPEDIVQVHRQRIIQQFHQAEAERRANTGNASTGNNAGTGAKKPKFESPSDLKKRLAEHKAKKAAEQAAGISSGDVTPLSAAHGGQSPAVGQSPGFFVSLTSDPLKRKAAYSFHRLVHLNILRSRAASTVLPEARRTKLIQVSSASRMVHLSQPHLRSTNNRKITGRQGSTNIPSNSRQTPNINHQVPN